MFGDKLVELTGSLHWARFLDLKSECGALCVSMFPNTDGDL